MTENQITGYTMHIWNEANSKLSNVKPIVLLISSFTGAFVLLKFCQVIKRSEKKISKRLFAYVFSYIRIIPFVRRKIQDELLTMRSSLEHSIHGCDSELNFIKNLPSSPLKFNKILAKAKDYFNMNQRFDVLKGQVSGAVYTDMAPNHLDILSEIFKLYAFSNPLHPDVFPGCRKMEAEVVRMVANFFHGPPESCGTMTTGGTESIILVCYASRNRALAHGVVDPVIIAPVTVHAGFEKAASLLGIRIRYVAVDPITCTMNIRELKNAISSDACLLVGSVPNFPTGTVDNIPAIAELGLKYKIPVHVDACLGGFIVAFAEDIGLNIPIFDFRLPGVTSISCDTHKYGCAPKGTSTILYRSAEYLHYQYFSVTDWPGGIYATPTLSGSRAGVNIALTWATLLHFGRDGYVQRAKLVTDATKYLADALRNVPGIEIVGSPDVTIVAFRSSKFNIYAVADKLNKLNWNLNTLQSPDSIHFCLTYNQVSNDVLNRFLADLQNVCTEIENSATKGSDSHTAGIYGMTAQIPDKSLIDEVAYMYLDSCYSMPLK